MSIKFQRGKRASAVSIIGGADGPTSIFIAGKSKKPNLAEGLRRRRARRKRAKAEASVTAGAHTLDEVIQYLKEKYHAIEVSDKRYSYKEQYKCLRESLIVRWRPELLGEASGIEDLKSVDPASVKRVMRQIELRSKAAEAVPDEQFPMDFHLYQVMIPEAGEIEFMIEKRWGVLTYSYTGKKGRVKRLEEIGREVHLYYGVSEEDIRDKTERYESLITVLSME